MAEPDFGGLIIDPATGSIRSVLPRWTMAFAGEGREGIVHFLNHEDVLVAACGLVGVWTIPFSLTNPDVQLCDECRAEVARLSGATLHVVPSEGEDPMLDETDGPTRTPHGSVQREKA